MIDNTIVYCGSAWYVKFTFIYIIDQHWSILSSYCLIYYIYLICPATTRETNHWQQIFNQQNGKYLFSVTVFFSSTIMTFQTLQITDLNTNQAATYTAIQEHFGPYFIIFLIIQCSYYVISYTLLLTWRLNAILFRCLGFLISYTVIVLLAHKSTWAPFWSPQLIF